MNLKFLKNEYIYSVGTKIIVILNSLIYQVLLSRYLGPELKGTTTYIASVASTSGIIIALGLNQMYPSFKFKIKNTQDAINQYLSIVFVIFSFYIAIATFLFFLCKANINIAVSILLSPIFAYSYIINMLCLIENPNKRNKALYMISIIETLYVGLIYFCTQKNYLLGITVIIFSEIMKDIYFTYFVYKNLNFSFSFRNIKFNNVKYLLSKGIFPMIAYLLNVLNYKIDVLMLKEFSNITMADIGIYSIGIAIAEKVLLVPDAIKEVLMSKLSKGAKEDEVCKLSRICFPLCIISGIFISIVAYPTIMILFGREYSGAYTITVISVLGVAFMTFMKLIDTYNIVFLKQKITVMLLSISVVFNIIFNILLIPIYGIIGAAIATILGHIMCSTAFVIYFHKLTNIDIKKIIFLQKEDYGYLKSFKKLIIKKVEN